MVGGDRISLYAMGTDCKSTPTPEALSVKETEHPKRDAVEGGVFDVVFDNVGLYGVKVGYLAATLILSISQMS